MCMFMNELPRNSRSAESTKKPNLFLGIKPTPEKEYYRFRLLAFSSPSKNDRDYPFIERYVHQHWGKNDKGKSIITDTVICPVTKYVKTEGNPYNECPICRYANNNFLAWKESNWKDKESAKKQREFSRKFEAIVPVYVVSDPVYDRNNNKFKVLIFSDKDFYKKFKAKIQEVSRTACCFNGNNAVDFYIHMTQVPKVVNEGTPNQYIFNENVIDKFGFIKPEKAYSIPAINKQNIDATFPFDETYYVTSTKEELKAFYDKYIKISNDDIPDDDVAIYEPPVKSAPVKKTNEVVRTQIENDDIMVNDEPDSIDDIASSMADDNDEVDTVLSESKVNSSSEEDVSTENIDQLISGLGDLLE